MVEGEPRGCGGGELTVDTTTWIDVWGVTIGSPVTAGTNLVVALQCAYYALHFRGAGSERRTGWTLFFAAMALATLAGVPKHGLRHLLGGDVLASVLWTSSVASGAAVYFAQRATIASRAQSVTRRHLERVAGAQVALFLAANVVLGPEILLIIAHTAVGLVPVIVVEALARRGGDERGGWVASGLMVSLLTGLVYVFELSLGRWFNHIDLAHALMGVSFYLIARGVPDTSRDRVGAREEWAPPHVRPVARVNLAGMGGAQGGV